MKTLKSIMFLSLVFLLMFSNSGYGGENWVQYGTDNFGNVHSYDKSSIRQKTKDIIQVWERIDFSNKGTEKETQDKTDEGLSLKGGNRNVSFTLSIYQINCSEIQYHYLYLSQYDTDDRLINSFKFEEPDWRYIPPYTLIDELRKKVCEK